MILFYLLFCMFESFVISENNCNAAQVQDATLTTYVHWDYKYVKLCTEKHSKKRFEVVVDELECGSWLISFP